MDTTPRPSSPAADMAARYRPSQAQIDAAEAALATIGHGTVVTGLVVVNKTQSIWTTDAIVLTIPGVFADRNEASEAIQKAVRSIGEATGQPTMGAYTYHSNGGLWSVFEDCLAEFVPAAV